MKTCDLFVDSRRAFGILLSGLATGIIGASLAGCGSGTKTVTPPANTSVTLLLTSTANNQSTCRRMLRSES
ncbi:MAG TPA: hypothetical protein VN875_04960 [Candidatus Binatus sp.]|jgi:hypothetical protein|nr:hypothetical protein [Candidatus Binatus sp.]